MNELEDVLKVTKHVFDKHNITFWLNFGTLLGAVREGKIISWDRDIDIGVWFEQIIEIYKTKDEFLSHGYRFYGKPHHLLFQSVKTNKTLMCVYPYISYKKYVMNVNIVRGFSDLINFVLSSSSSKLHDKIFYFLMHVVLYFKLYYKNRFVLVPKSCMGDLSTIDFYDEKYKIPSDSDKYLTFIYGNWRVPDKFNNAVHWGVGIN